MPRLLLPAAAAAAAQYASYVSSSTSISISLSHKEIVILGTQYAGESKKGIWT
jgi:phosphoenolpyruvate carboxykinase (ATP)